MKYNYKFEETITIKDMVDKGLSSAIEAIKLLEQYKEATIMPAKRDEMLILQRELWLQV